MKIRILFNLFLFYFLLGPNSQTSAQWVQQALGYNVPGVVLAQLIAIDEDIVWGNPWQLSSGSPIQAVSKTTNGGVNWLISNIPGYQNCYISDISAISANLAVIEITPNNPSTPTILMTTDGGNTWQVIPSIADNQFPLCHSHFWNPTKGVAVGYNYNHTALRFYTTEDGGNTWVNQDSSAYLNFIGTGESIGNDARYVEDSTVIYFSGCGRLFISSDWGNHWTTKITPLYSNGQIGSYRFKFQDKNKGVIYDQNLFNQQFYFTENAGNTWVIINDTAFELHMQYAYIPGTINTFIRTDARLIESGTFYTTNGGASWIEFPELIGKRTASTVWVNNHTGWVSELTGSNPISSGVFKFGGVFSEVPWEDINTPKVKYYPTPCTSELHCWLSGFRGRKLQFLLLNELGQVVTNTSFTSDQDQDVKLFNINHLSKGPYYARITSNSMTSVQKIIIQ